MDTLSQIKTEHPDLAETIDKIDTAIKTLLGGDYTPVFITHAPNWDGLRYYYLLPEGTPNALSIKISDTVREIERTVPLNDNGNNSSEIFTTPPLHPEPAGCVSHSGFVKNNPLNNEHYLATVGRSYADIFSQIITIHNIIKKYDPNYNIVQIKEKFGELRYYYDLTLNDAEMRRRVDEEIRPHENEASTIMQQYEKTYNKDKP